MPFFVSTFPLFSLKFSDLYPTMQPWKNEIADKNSPDGAAIRLPICHKQLLSTIHTSCFAAGPQRKVVCFLQSCADFGAVLLLSGFCFLFRFFSGGKGVQAQ